MTDKVEAVSSVRIADQRQPPAPQVAKVEDAEALRRRRAQIAAYI